MIGVEGSYLTLSDGNKEEKYYCLALLASSVLQLPSSPSSSLRPVVLVTPLSMAASLPSEEEARLELLTGSSPNTAHSWQKSRKKATAHR